MRLAIIFALFFLLAIALVLILRPSGPRVTRIERRRKEDNDGEGPSNA